MCHRIQGKFKFETETYLLNLKLEGDFSVLPPEEGNHGPVRVANTYHFAYEDGTPYYSIRTTLGAPVG